MIRLLIAILLFSSSLHATLPKERRLKKLSMHIRGENPSPGEYAELKKVYGQDQEKYFKDKALEYLATENHQEKMNLRLSQLFRLNLADSVKIPYTPKVNNALNNLFKEIAAKNLSWDTLLTGKKYKLAMGVQDFGGSSDYGFLGAVLPFDEFQVNFGIINKSKNYIKQKITFSEEGYRMHENGAHFGEHEFGSGDSRIAGALTTRRFFDRYVNTAINKNRKRAAAVFRIFLCDEMEAAITDSQNRTEYILDFVFPDTTGMSTNDVNSLSLADSAHGQRPDCMACHYKLDPMGRNFGGSGNSLAPVAFNGALSYQTKNGKKVSIPTSGLGDLAAKLVEQKDYKSCQTKHFWDWFIGEDRYLSKEVQSELVEEYERVDGRVNDFISYLVNRQEFYDADNMGEEVQLTYRVKGTLKSCNSCHESQNIPSFTDWPIENEKGDMTYWVNKISTSLDLKQETGQPTMPPTEHPLQPSSEELNDINEWIKLGAPNEQGIPQIY